MKKTISIVVAAGSPFIGGYLAEDTKLSFDVIDGDMVGKIDPEDVVAETLAAHGASELLPTLTHKNEDGLVVAYSPSGGRVEQTAEAAAAAKVAAKAGPDNNLEVTTRKFAAGTAKKRKRPPIAKTAAPAKTEKPKTAKKPRPSRAKAKDAAPKADADVKTS